jgi:ATP-dependent exoDNAse (exonuclease V) beta subunit
MQQIPDFSHIQFDRELHRYSAGGQPLTGVTSFLKAYQPEFDKAGVSARVAEREGRSVASVLQEWEAKAAASIALGTQVHEYIERCLTYGRGEPEGGDPFLGLNHKLPEQEAFDRAWVELEKAVAVCAVEWVIGDEELGVAGMVDCLVYSAQTGKYHLLDWKTGKFDVHNKFENLLSPFDNYSAAKLNIYSLQLSLYRLILDRAGLETGDAYLVHLDSGWRIHKATDFRPQFEQLFRQKGGDPTG